MNREQLAHVLRSAASIARDGNILVLGSQAILGTRDSSHLPVEVTLSVEADLAFRLAAVACAAKNGADASSDGRRT